MRLGEQRTMKDGRIFEMTRARIVGNKIAADKRRGTRFVRLQVPERCHPLVRRFFEECNRQRLPLTTIAARAGVKRHTMSRWRFERSPNLTSIEAALQVVGLQLAAVPIRESEAP